ncbi:MAG: NrfD/PsrC family molybdoenzyme membrane anchor subunit [Nitrospirota bacterium]|nr:NrfD/PsrC family molybdoenzyme membrane anchor subunit [Nitrospirota bacterium]
MDVRTTLPADSSKKWFPIGLGIGLVMILVGLQFGLYRIVFIGHETLSNTKEVPWNIFIVNYAFAISSIGLSYLSSFGIVLGIKQFDIIARRSLLLAILIIIAGIMSVAVDMRQPMHAIYMLLTPHVTSALGIVALCINLYLALIILELYLIIKRGHHDLLVKAVAIAAFAMAVVVHSYHGAIFGLSYSRTFWNGPYYPIYFLLSALFASSSMIILVTVVTYRVMGKQISEKLHQTLMSVGKVLLAYLLSIGLFFLYWKMTAGHYFHKKEAYILLTGEYWVNFWVFEVLIGYLIPIVIIAYSRFKDLNKMAFASFLIIIGIYVGRYDFIIVGQLVPYLGFTPFDSELGGSLASLASYAPNLTEIALSIGLFGFIWTGYVLGVKYLPLSKDEE